MFQNRKLPPPDHGDIGPTTEGSMMTSGEVTTWLFTGTVPELDSWIVSPCWQGPMSVDCVTSGFQQVVDV